MAITLSIKALHMELTPAIRSYLGKKLDHIEKFLDSDKGGTHVQVELGKTTAHHGKGDVFRAEGHMRFAGEPVNASADAPDLYAAIDLMQAMFEREVTKLRKRSIVTERKGSRKIKELLHGSRV